MIMISDKVKKILGKQHYVVVGEHSGVQVCRWTKNSLRNKGVCYKEKFYGIKSHECCQMSPSIIFCQNSCIHCWRPIELCQGEKIKKIDSPEKIIEKCIEGQRKLLNGFKGYDKVNKKKLEEAQNPTQFAISLSGEPTIYQKLPELIKLLRKKKISSFLVTNGLNSKMIKKLKQKKALPTQLYLSLNSPNEKMYNSWHKSKQKNAWEKFNETLSLFSDLPTRKVIRMTLVRDLNIDEKYIPEYSELIKKAKPDFIEVKGFMSVGYSRKRLGYEKMPTHEEIKKFSKLLAKKLKLKILDEQVFSRVVLLGKNKKNMKIKIKEI